MVKLIVKICAFFIIFGMILCWMKSCEGDYIDKFLDDYFSSKEDKDEDEITYDDIKNADPDQFNHYSNVMISKINQQYISYNSTNISISQDISSTNTLIEQCNQSITSQTAYINKTNINQPILINWVSDNRNNISQLEKLPDELSTKIDKLRGDIHSLTHEIRSLEDAVNENQHHFEKYIIKYNKNVIDEETVKYNAIQEDLKERIANLSNKISSLKAELKSNREVRNLNRSVKRCIRRLEEINEKLDKLIEQSGASNTVASEEDDKTYYFIIDTKAKLKDKGIITSGGLFDGVHVVNNPNKDEFGILTDKNKTISLGDEEDSFELLSNHPEGSFEYRTINTIKVIIIKDVKAFWSKTQYLVILKK